MRRSTLFLSVSVLLQLPPAGAAELTQLDQFTVPHPARDVVYDGRRGQFWLSDDLDKKLVSVGWAERGVTATHAVAQTPESLALSPDGAWLYAALITRPHDYYWFDAHIGYITEVPLETGGAPRTIEIPQDPYDLVVTDAGVLTVTDGSGQWTSISSYEIRSDSPTVPVATLNIRQMSPIVLHPDQHAAFSITTDSSPADISHWVLGGAGGVVSGGWDSRYHGDYPMSAPLWIQPDGERIFTAPGGVFLLDPVQANDLVYLRTLAGGPFTAMAFDAENKTLFAGSGTTLRMVNLASLEDALQFNTGRPITQLAVAGTNLLVVTVEPTRTTITRYANPALGADANESPVARFGWTPAAPSVLDTIQFSAADSTDDGPKNALQYRWDWNSDGTFDTDFSPNPIWAIRFDVAGTKQVTVEVRDGFGAVGRKKQAVDVALVADPGNPISTNIAFGLQFAALDVAADPKRRFVYASDPAGKRLVRVNLTTGFIDREFFFNYGPERLTITPNGERLYVVIPAQPHTYFGGQQKGFVAEVDLATGTRTRLVDVDVDPFDIVATDDGLLVISDGSNQWTTLTLHEAATGSRLSSTSLYMGAIINLTPDQRAVYQVNAGLSPADLNRHSFTAAGVFTGSWDSPYHGDYPTGEPFPHPTASRVISSGGSIYTASDSQVSDLRYVGPLPGGAFNDLAYDVANGAFFTVRSGGTNILTAYNLDSLQEARVIGLPAAAQRVHVSGPVLVLTSIGQADTRFTVLANPMEGAKNNQPPVASFEWSPPNPTTLDRVRFDPAGSSDDDGASNLSVRWDWNGDGVYDTSFGPLGLATNRFNYVGNYSVVAEVRDNFGAVASVTKTVSVSLAADPGKPVTGSTPFELGFVPADVAFDPVRPHLYATDKAGRRLVRLDLTTGLTEREFNFDLMPERLAITPNGERMYVALLTREHSSYWFDGYTGVIGEFDLTAGVMVREFPVNIDPYDLVATDAGWLAISSGSGQWTSMKSFKAATGGEISTVGVREGSPLTLNAAQDTVYASLVASPSDFQRIELNPATGELTNRGDSPYHGDHPMGYQCWALADGRTVITSEGGVYTSLQSFITALNTPVADALANVGRGQVFIINQDRLRAYKLEEFSFQSEQRVPAQAAYLGDHDGRLYVVSQTATSAFITSRQYPARNAAENLAPEVVVKIVSPGSGVGVGQQLTASADASDQDGDVTQVEFQVDGVKAATVNSGPPWTRQLGPFPVGTHTLTALATDNWGATNSSAPVSFAVSQPPTVALTAKLLDNNDPASVELVAVPADSDGTVQEVVFYNGDTELGRLSGPAFRWVLTDVPRGVYNYSAVAIDNIGVRSQPAVAVLGVNLLPGDYFANRIVLTGTEATVTADTRQATREPGEPFHASIPGAHSLWWEWTPPKSTAGTLVLDTAGSSYDTVMVIYVGAAVNQLQQVAANDNAGPGVLSSRLKLLLNATATPTRYLIAVDAHGDAAGDLRLGLSFVPGAAPGSNDRFAQRQILTGVQGETSGVNFTASPEPSEPFHAGNRAQRSLWWSWKAPVDGRLTLTTEGSTMDTVLAAYTGFAINALSAVAANDDSALGVLTSGVEFAVSADTTYQIAVDGFQGQTGFIHLGYSFEPAIVGRVVRRPDAGIEIRFEAQGRDSLVIEGSPDLSSWKPLETVPVLNGSVVWPVPSGANEPTGFFRARTP